MSILTWISTIFFSILSSVSFAKWQGNDNAGWFLFTLLMFTALLLNDQYEDNGGEDGEQD
jgi:hypothetical protein